MEEKRKELEEKEKDLKMNREELLEISEQTEMKAKDIKELFKEGKKRSDLKKLNKQLLRDFIRIWIRFQKVDAHIGMHPEPSSFAEFIDFPENWKFKDEFDFSKLKTLRLINKHQENSGGNEDGLVIEYHPNEDDEIVMELFFEYCEENRYSRYWGWGKMVNRYSLFCEMLPIEDDKMGEFHERLKDFVKKWYESHLTRHRDLILDYVESEYEKVERDIE